MIQIFDKIIAFGTLLLAASTILVIVSVFMDKQSPVVQLTKKYSTLIIFIISFLAMCISLIYSNFFGYTPCYLCWFQRIFIYPSVLFSGIALYKKDNHIVSYIETENAKNISNPNFVEAMIFCKNEMKFLPDINFLNELKE